VTLNEPGDIIAVRFTGGGGRWELLKRPLQGGPLSGWGDASQEKNHRKRRVSILYPRRADGKIIPTLQSKEEGENIYRGS